MQPQPEKEDVKDAVVFSTVTTPPVRSVEIVNPTLKPQEGFCNWCRKKPGEIFCDGWPICFGCIDLIIDRENAIAENLGILEAPLPQEWEKDARNY